MPIVLHTRHMTDRIRQVMIYPVKRPLIHPGTASIPNGRGVGVPSFAHRSRSPSLHPPSSELIQSDAVMATIIRKQANKHNKNPITFIGLGFDVVTIVVDILMTVSLQLLLLIQGLTNMIT